jgi:hypothetical protein
MGANETWRTYFVPPGGDSELLKSWNPDETTIGSTGKHYWPPMNADERR